MTARVRDGRKDLAVLAVVQTLCKGQLKNFVRKNITVYAWLILAREILVAATVARFLWWHFSV
jgi:hypothetical protein